MRVTITSKDIPKQAPNTITTMNKNKEVVDEFRRLISLTIKIYPKTINTSSKIRRFRKWLRKKINFIIINIKIIALKFKVKVFLDIFKSLKIKKISVS